MNDRYAFITIRIIDCHQTFICFLFDISSSLYLSSTYTPIQLSSDFVMTINVPGTRDPVSGSSTMYHASTEVTFNPGQSYEIMVTPVSGNKPGPEQKEVFRFSVPDEPVQGRWTSICIKYIYFYNIQVSAKTMVSLSTVLTITFCSGQHERGRMEVVEDEHDAVVSAAASCSHHARLKTVWYMFYTTVPRSGTVRLLLFITTTVIIFTLLAHLAL